MLSINDLVKKTESILPNSNFTASSEKYTTFVTVKHFSEEVMRIMSADESGVVIIECPRHSGTAGWDNITNYLNSLIPPQPGTMGYTPFNPQTQYSGNQLFRSPGQDDYISSLVFGVKEVPHHVGYASVRLSMDAASGISVVLLEGIARNNQTGLSDAMALLPTLPPGVSLIELYLNTNVTLSDACRGYLIEEASRLKVGLGTITYASHGAAAKLDYVIEQLSK